MREKGRSMLVVQDLHFGYGSEGVLRGFAMEVGRGEMVGIVGPNGVGKTTILRLISGVLSPSRGRVFVDGSDITTLTAAQRGRLVSVVPQNPRLPLGFKLLDLVMMGRNPHLGLLQWEGERDVEAARTAMEMTGLWRLADRAVGTLSGGEQQRAVVALALTQEAPVMLLDEPTSSLDLAHQTGILDLVTDVQHRLKGTVVMAIHDLTLAAQYCDRLVMLAGGREYADGAPRDVLTEENVSHVYGAEVFILSHPQHGTPVVLPRSGKGLDYGPGG